LNHIKPWLDDRDDKLHLSALANPEDALRNNQCLIVLVGKINRFASLYDLKRLILVFAKNNSPNDQN
jgi:hypothetical protein